MKSPPAAAATDRLTILHVVAPCEAGGLERVVHSLAAGHRAAGHDVAVAAVLDAPRTEHPFLDPLRANGVAVFPCSVAPRRYLEERRLIAQVIDTVRPHVVHTHGYRVDVLGAGVARRAGVPTVTTVHGFTAGDWKNRVYEWLQCRAFRRFDGVVAVSRPLREQLAQRGVPEHRLHLVPNAWSNGQQPLGRDAARALLGVAEDRFHLGWVGRLGHEKGADVLLDSLPLLRDLPFQLSVIGYGRELASLKRRAAELGVGQQVRWHGIVPDAARLFASFDAFVLSSRTEGTPIVLFEAIAALTPIVATRVGGVPDVVSSAEALLVEPEAPASLAAAIRAVHADPDAAAARAARARRRLDAEFSSEPWLARYESLYRAVQRTTS